MSTSSRKILRVLLPFIIFIFLAMIAIMIMGSAPEPEKKEEVTKAPLIAAYEVELKNQPLVINSYGVIKPKHQTSLVAQVSGQVTDVSSVFASGGIVKKGDLLAQIDPSDYQAALIEAQANLQRATAALQEEQARGIVAKKEWQGATSSLPPALGLRKPQLAREQANLRSAQASLARAERNLSRTKIVAPYNALINSRNVDLGQFASMGTTLGIVSSIDAGEIRLPISSADYNYLADSDRSDVVLKRFENGVEQQWSAKIIRDEGVIDENSRMIYLVAEIKNPYKSNPKLKFGTFVDAAVQSEIHNNIAIIPSHLYREGHVTLVSDNRELHKQKVNVLKRDKTNVYIESGLQTGDLILDTKIEHLYEGMKVRLAGDKEEIAPVVEDESAIELAAGDK
jgi:multidrug efflux system membrane fusion protein